MDITGLDDADIKLVVLIVQYLGAPKTVGTGKFHHAAFHPVSDIVGSFIATDNNKAFLKADELMHHRKHQIVSQIAVEGIAEKGAFALEQVDTVIDIVDVDIGAAASELLEILSCDAKIGIFALKHGVQCFKGAAVTVVGIQRVFIKNSGGEELAKNFAEEAVVGHLVRFFVFTQNVFHKFGLCHAGEERNHFGEEHNAETGVEHALEEGGVGIELGKGKEKNGYGKEGIVETAVIASEFCTFFLYKPLNNRSTKLNNNVRTFMLQN